jgi:hypothetical protein
MTGVIMRIIGLEANGPSEWDGLYIVDYDPTIRADKSVLLETTPSPSLAKIFPSAREAMELYRAVSPNQPRRYDGQPNRPLTAFSVEILPAP